MPKTITILGSTGSIGTQTLDIIRQRRDEFEVIGFSAGNNLKLFIDQIKEFKPQYVTLLNDSDKQELRNLFPKLEILKDTEELASVKQIDIIVGAIVGIAGLKANLAALKQAKRVAIANKEALVVASHLVRELTQEHGSELIPIDSEHAAIHQCLGNYHQSTVKEILLTSSGGPFRTRELADFASITLEQALKHPKWQMGSKITIDSSTLMNKGLEVIEVNALFGIPYDDIQVVIHPEAIVHSAVTFIDANTIAQLSLPDMRVPIQYALDYPEKKSLKLSSDFDIFELAQLNFEKPDLQKFPALELAYAAGRAGHSMPTVLNAANEMAVALFLKSEIHYLDIAKIIEKELSQHKLVKNPSLEEIIEIHESINQSLAINYN